MLSMLSVEHSFLTFDLGEHPIANKISVMHGVTPSLKPLTIYYLFPFQPLVVVAVAEVVAAEGSGAALAAEDNCHNPSTRYSISGDQSLYCNMSTAILLSAGIITT